MRWNSFWGIALLLLMVLLVGAMIELAAGLAGIGQPARFWILYLVAHSCCYALVVTVADQRPLGHRLSIAAGFAGACVIGAMTFTIAVGFLIVGSTMVEALTVPPLAMFAITSVLATLGAGAGLGYGLCIVFLQSIWFPHLDDFRLSAVIQHVIWGLVAPLVVGVGLLVAKLMAGHQPAMTIPGYLAVVGLMWLTSMAHLELARRTAQLAGQGDEVPNEAPAAIRWFGLAVTVLMALWFVWSLKPA